MSGDPHDELYVLTRSLQAIGHLVSHYGFDGIHDKIVEDTGVLIAELADRAAVLSTAICAQAACAPEPRKVTDESILPL